MTVLMFLIPVTLGMGAVGLAAFFWSLRSGQYEDLSGDAERILFDDDDTPLAPKARHLNKSPKARHLDKPPEARQCDEPPKAQRTTQETTR